MENYEKIDETFKGEEGKKVTVDAEIFHLDNSKEEMDVVKLQERLNELYKEINEIEQKLGIAESKTAA